MNENTRAPGEAQEHKNPHLFGDRDCLSCKYSIVEEDALHGICDWADQSPAFAPVAFLHDTIHFYIKNPYTNCPTWASKSTPAQEVQP